MNWIKKGLIYCPDGTQAWNQKKYAHVVCADNSNPDIFRLYYSARDAQGRCQASFIDLNPNNLSEVIYEHPEPILDLGEPGTFDDCGIMPTWFLNHQAKWRRKMVVLHRLDRSKYHPLPQCDWISHLNRRHSFY